MKRYYFAYGMNTNIAEMSMRCPAAINLGCCTLKGFELKFRLHADIDQVDSSEMEGVLWDITPDCERALDSLEGYPFYYDKIEVIVDPVAPVNKNSHVVAMAYTMTRKGPEEPPSENYERCLVEGYTENGLDTNKLLAKIEEIIINKPGYV
jgi:hypothetical protein